MLQLIFEDWKHLLLHLQRFVMPELCISKLYDNLSRHIILPAFGNIFQIIINLSIRPLAFVIFFKAIVKFLIICFFQIIKNIISADKYVYVVPTIFRAFVLAEIMLARSRHFFRGGKSMLLVG